MRTAGSRTLSESAKDPGHYLESINASIRKVTSKRGAFPTADSVRKVLYLAIARASERWRRPVKDWSAALNHFAIVFEGRVTR